MRNANSTNFPNLEDGCKCCNYNKQLKYFNIIEPILITHGLVVDKEFGRELCLEENNNKSGVRYFRISFNLSAS